MQRVYDREVPVLERGVFPFGLFGIAPEGVAWGSAFHGCFDTIANTIVLTQGTARNRNLYII